MRKTNLIALSSAATGGKDTLYNILEKIFKQYSITSDRLALADPLKSEINSFTQAQYNISAFTKDPKEKELIRPLMVIHGKIKRTQTSGKYFTSLAQERLNSNITDNILTIVTDIRYSSYSEDELYWLKSNNGILIHIERINVDGQIIEPANIDEKENDPKIKSAADYHLRWPTTDNEQLREDFVKTQLKDLIEKIINEKN
jgi:hypothetical protein